MVTPIEKGAELLRRGGLVAFPTETVYGLGADAANARAVARIFTVKGRPAGHPLIVHLADASLVATWASLDHKQAAMVDQLAAAFWPGPLTIVVPRSDLVASETVGGRATIGLRVPDHPIALELLQAFGGGIAAPSANRFGRVSPTTAEHVRQDLGDLVELIIDGGPTEVGVESTIVELIGSNAVLLRPGGVSRPRLAAALGSEVVDGRDGEARASGMLRSHYAPRAMVEVVDPDELTVRLGRISTDVDRRQQVVGVIAPFAVDCERSWELPSDSAGYARELYAALRAVDDHQVDLVLIVAPTDGELSDAVLDRLTKAAAPRP